MMTTQHLLTEVRHPEPLENLVEGIPVKDGIKLSDTHLSIQKSKGIPWTELRGLAWVFNEEWS